jgi:hypothetical protein
MAEPIPNEQLFVIADTGNQGMYPRDPRIADPKDIVNCGCTTLARYPNDRAADASVLAHVLSRGFLTIDQMTRRLAAREATR